MNTIKAKETFIDELSQQINEFNEKLQNNFVNK